ncbi:MAG: oxaloacetate decarboxylase [Acidimicrobiia bacterium]
MSGSPSDLRRLLGGSQPVIAPGVFNALFARIVERAGFPAVYVSGAGVANSLLGQPDIGMVTMSEMVTVAANICNVVDIPVIVDADTGFGGVHNVARTVIEYQRAGVAAIQIEDQKLPKRCGHFDSKEVVPVGEMLDRIHAACDARAAEDGILIIARTDAAGPHGIDEAISRAARYGEAGADLLFVEAPRNREELERVGRELSAWPLVANMVEHGKTPLLPAAELAELGFSLVIFPGSITRTVTRAAETVLEHLASKGSTSAVLGVMASFDEVNEVVGLTAADDWEREIIGRASGRERRD